MNRNLKARAVRRSMLGNVLTETLESRRLMCALHADELDRALAIASAAGGTDHSQAWYRPVATADAAGDATFNVNAAGLPLLTSRDDGQGFKVFLDFDGHGSNLPFSTDPDTATFNASEQTVIYDTWRDIVSFFSPLNVNVTTVQPPTGGSNPAFAWQLTSNSISGGYAYVGWLDNSAPHGFTASDNATGRHSGLAHEIGHLLGLSHQSEYDKWGNKTSEYTDGFGARDRAIIGVDYNENVRTWIYGRDSDSPLDLVDDLTVMANTIKARIGGDGYRPDDHGATLATATAVPSVGTVASFLERMNDVDVFRFTSSGGTYQIDATPTYESAAAAKIELLDALGNVIASRDDADQRNQNNNDQEFSLELPAGTFYVRVTSSGDTGELGEYTLTAAPLMSGWRTQDVQQVYRGGTAAYDPATNTLRQLGGGTDIWTSADQFRFTSATLTGDGSITTRVDSLDNVDPIAKAGLMIRQSNASGSAHVYLGVKPSGEIETIRRTSTGVLATNVTNTAGQVGPWIRLTRTGNSFLLQRSADGLAWVSIATTSVTMSGPVLIGFATNSRSAREATWATYSNIAVTGTLGTPAPTYNGLAAPTTLSASPITGAGTSVVLNWTDAPDETGYAIDRSVDGVNFTQVAQVNANVTTYTDLSPFGSMRYYYRVASLSGVSRSIPSTSVSVVNKPGTPGSAIGGYAVPFIALNTTQVLLNWADVQGDEGYRVERSTDGGANFTLIASRPKNANAYNVSGLNAGTSYLFRITAITNVGDQVAGSLLINAATRLNALTNLRFTARTPTTLDLAWNDATNETGYTIERSTDRVKWAEMAILNPNVTSWTDSGLADASEYYYRVQAFNSLTQGMEAVIFAATPSTGALPATWTNQDVGTVPGAGAASVIGSTWRVLGAGNDIWGTNDQFHYASRVVQGDASIVARIASLENTNTYVKGGVMFRASTAATAAYAFLALSPDVGLQFEVRDATGVNSVNLGIVSTTARFVRLTRVGNVFTAAYSANGTTWTDIASRTIAMPASITQGLAVTSHNPGLMALATFDNVATTGGVANTAPVITVAAAANPSQVTGTSTILSVTATDDGGPGNLSYAWSTVSRPNGAPDVSFRDNSATTNATFFMAGTYALRVTVTDAQGLFVGSTAIITVKSTATGLSIAPVTDVAPAATQQFSATVLNQFGHAMQTSLTWSSSAGTMDADGLWTAPADAGTATITVVAGDRSATTDVNVQLVHVAKAFDVNAAQPQVRFGFNGDLGSSLTADDLVLTNLADGSVIPAASVAAAFNTGSREATFGFAALAGGVLPNGNYRATIAAGSVFANGVPLAAEASFEFFVLAGDADRDRDVDFDDLLALSRNYGQVGRSFTDGNFDYSADGLVSFDDLLMLARNYGAKIALPTPPLIPQASMVASNDKRQPAAKRISL